MSRQLWLFAGPNGAGKSTFAKSPEFSSLLAPQFLNPDDVCRVLLIERGFCGFQDAPPELQRECSIQAANLVFEEVKHLLLHNSEVGVETVLSTDKYFPLAWEVDLLNLIYIGNRSPEISIERVALRVRKGGHDVPEDKIRARWHRSLEKLPQFWKLAHQAWLFDNSDLPELIAHKRQKRTEFLASTEKNVLLQALLKGGIQPE